MCNDVNVPYLANMSGKMSVMTSRQTVFAKSAQFMNQKTED